MTHCLMGIDDNDNLERRGTGHRVRQLAAWLNENKLGIPKGITRHQFLKNGKSTLYVEEQNHEWQILSKEQLKSLSN